MEKSLTEADREAAAAIDIDKLEAEFLGDLELKPIPIDRILHALQSLQRSSKSSVLETWLHFLIDKLIETGAREEMIQLFSLLATWRNDHRTFAGVCHVTLKRVSQERLWLAFVDSVAWGEVAPQESIRRLQFLLQCKPGAAVFDKTWGFGIVSRVDDFYKRMTVDFDNKPNHALALTNAAANLVLMPPEHILALRHRDKAAFAKLLAENPAEVVRLMLRSFGEMPQPRLADLLAEHNIVTTAGWKEFWERARHVLRHDPLFELPTRRTEPLRLRQTELKFDDAWFDSLARERSLPTLLRQIEALAADEAAQNLNAAARKILSDRLNFALNGSTSHAGRYATIALMVERLGLEEPAGVTMATHLLAEGRFVAAAESVTGRRQQLLVEFLLRHVPDATQSMLAILQEQPLALVTTLCDLLLTRDDETRAAVAARCCELTTGTIAPAPLLVWLLRNLEVSEGWQLPTRYELLGQAIHYIEDPTLSGENLRMKHHLVALFEKNSWFEPLFKGLEPLQRAALFARIQGSSDFGDATTQRSLVGKMVRFDPALTAQRQAATVSASQQPESYWTSWRTLNQRLTQLRHLVEVELPKNSADIAHARSYGDLKENFEYHAARQQQELLLRRREEWENELRQVRGSSFETSDTSCAGMGTVVTLKVADGSERRYVIMGLWDNDDALGIIPCRSRVAVALAGKKSGEEVRIPTAEGSESATVVSITPLSAELLAWTRNEANATAT